MWRNQQTVVDTVFCPLSICVLDLEKSKNIIFSPWCYKNIQNDVVVLDTPLDITHEMTGTQEPRRSRRIIRPPVRFIGLGETYEAISEEVESDPYTYKEAIKDIDA